MSFFQNWYNALTPGQQSMLPNMLILSGGVIFVTVAMVIGHYLDR